jgi:hypothetical protein
MLCWVQITALRDQVAHVTMVNFNPVKRVRTKDAATQCHQAEERQALPTSVVSDRQSPRSFQPAAPSSVPRIIPPHSTLCCACGAIPQVDIAGPVGEMIVAVPDGVNMQRRNSGVVGAGHTVACGIPNTCPVLQPSHRRNAGPGGVPPCPRCLLQRSQLFFRPHATRRCTCAWRLNPQRPRPSAWGPRGRPVLPCATRTAWLAWLPPLGSAPAPARVLRLQRQARGRGRVPPHPAPWSRATAAACQRKAS